MAQQEASSALETTSNAQASMAQQEASSALETTSNAQASSALQTASNAQASSAQEIASSAQQTVSSAQKAASSAEQQAASSAQEQFASSAQEVVAQASSAQKKASAAQEVEKKATASAAQQTASMAQEVAAQASSAQKVAATTSAAQVAATTALQSTNVATSSTAAQTLSSMVTTQVQSLAASGSSAAASALLISTLTNIRSSTAFTEGDPDTLAIVATLTALANSIVQNNPTNSASSAQASAANSALLSQLQSSDPNTSALAATNLTETVTSQVQYLIAIGSYAAAGALIQTTINTLNQSPSGSSSAIQGLVAQLSTLSNNIVAIDPSSKASSAQASAAQKYYTTALQNTDVPTSVAASTQLSNSVTTTVQSLLAAGSFSTAITLLTQTIDLLYTSTAYMNNDPQVLAQIAALNTTLKQATQANPGAMASAAQASAAQAYYTGALQNSDTTVSIPAAKTMVSSVQSTVANLIALGSFSTATALIAEALQQLKSSPAASSPDVVAMITTLTTLQGSVTKKDPYVRSSSAQASAAQQYYATALQNTSVQDSVAAATQLSSSVTANVQGLVAAGSYSTAITLLTQAIDLLYTSTAYKNNDPQVLAQIATLIESLKQTQQANPGAQASAAQASAAQSSYVADLRNADTTVSVPAATSMVSLVKSTVTSLMALGSFSTASALITDTLAQLRASPAANTPEVVAIIATLVALQSNVTTTDPSVRSSSAQASAAQQYYVTSLQNTSVQASVAAATQLSSSVTANVQGLVAAGSYSTAITLLTQTIDLLYTSTAYKNNDPQVLAQIATLVESLKQTQQANPGAQASAAEASAAQTSYAADLRNADTTVSVPAATKMVSLVKSTITTLMAIGSFSTASTLITDTLAQLRASPAANTSEVVAMIATLVALQSNVTTTDPSVRSSSAQASAAQQYYTTALQNTSVQASVAAATQLSGSITASAQGLIAAGSYSTATTLLTQTIQLLYTSTAYKNRDPQVLAQIASLVTILKQAEQANPGAQASAAQASAAQASYAADIKNTDTKVSIPAATNMVSSVQSTVSTLVAMGSFSSASSMLASTLQQLYASPAANSPEVKALIANITALQNNINTTALQSADKATSLEASKKMTEATVSTVKDLIASGSYSNAISLLTQTTDLLYNSIGYKNGDPEILKEISSLRALLKQAQTNPETKASAAAASVAQASYVSDLKNTDMAVSISAAKNITTFVQSTVSSLIAMGSFSAASILITETLKQLRASPAASSPELLDHIQTLSTLQSIVTAITPQQLITEDIPDEDIIQDERGENVDYGEKKYGEGYGPTNYGDRYGQPKKGGSRSRKNRKKRKGSAKKGF